MMAMIKIKESEKLKKLGWILLMQIHDEVILEGPEETSEEAFEEVLDCMQEPWALGMEKTSVPLLVDGSCCHNNWYDVINNGDICPSLSNFELARVNLFKALLRSQVDC